MKNPLFWIIAFICVLGTLMLNEASSLPKNERDRLPKTKTKETPYYLNPVHPLNPLNPMSPISPFNPLNRP
jgi:hypothetical protein